MPQNAANGNYVARTEQPWFQDSAEDNALGLTGAEKASATLQAHIGAALAQLTAVSQRIQKVAAENETLRHEIAALRRLLAHQLAQQPA